MQTDESLDIGRAGGCGQLPAPLESKVPRALKFEGSSNGLNAHLTLTKPKNELLHDFSLNLSFRTKQKDGLLFFMKGNFRKMSNRTFPIHLAIYLKRGSIFLEVKGHKDGKNMLLKAGQELDDGKWHRISLEKKFRFLKLGLEGQESGSVTVRRRLPLKNPLYVGGIPADLKLQGLSTNFVHSSFDGCIRDFELNDQFEDLSGGVLHRVSDCLDFDLNHIPNDLNCKS